MCFTLFLLFTLGITGENLSRFFVHSRLTPEEQCSVYNMKHLGVTVLQEVSNDKLCYYYNSLLPFLLIVIVITYIVIVKIIANIHL